ncbi:MAG: hypothetical protein BJ554DRAFT_6474, partial [Olpidium bornovanus]
TAPLRGDEDAGDEDAKLQTNEDTELHNHKNLKPFSSIIAIFATWVDDIILTGPDNTVLDNITQALNARSSLTDGGALTHTLGVQVIRAENGDLHLVQRHYTEKVLEKFNHTTCHAEAIPLDPSAIASLVPRDDTAPAAEKARYSELLGSLNYLSTRTRPDIALAISFLFRFMANPSPAHWSALKRVLRYLCGTTGSGLRLPAAPGFGLRLPAATGFGPQLPATIGFGLHVPLQIVAYSDSDWACAVADRKSITGYLLQVKPKQLPENHPALHATIIWRSGKQSSCREISWFRHIVEDVLGDVDPIPLFMDNHGALEISRDTRRINKRSKHIDIRYLYVGEAAEQGKVAPQAVSSRENQADIFTKGLARPDFERHCQALGVVLTPFPT